MKSVLAVAALLTAGLPAAALSAPQATPAPAPPRATPAPAQSGAAATLPNTFDAPAGQPAQRPAPRPSAPAAVDPAAPGGEQSSPAKVAAAEAILRKTIAAMQAGTPNYGDMTADLAEKVRAQAGNVLPMFEQLGALAAVSHVATQDGAELFSVIFANAPTQWIIAQNDQGKIVALLFRPAPPPEAS